MLDRRSVLESPGESIYQGGDVSCSNCQAAFTPVVYEVSEPKGIRVEFVCPECRRKYIVAHISKRGLEIRAQLATVGGQAPKAMREINERVRTIRRLRGMLKKHVTR